MREDSPVEIHQFCRNLILLNSRCRARYRIEENWTTLTRAILEYWMNHHWLEKQKLRANRAGFREVGQQRESSSEYVICKMELLMLVYSYMDTETIQAIMMEVPGT
jgi:hypothetical protein